MNIWFVVFSISAVKNQARWVQQFISDMELLHHETKDENFNIIIVDFQSDDMDIEQALRESSVPRYMHIYCFCLLFFLLFFISKFM